MTDRIAAFLAKCASETYPEPRAAGHDKITVQMAERVKPFLPIGAAVLDVGCGKGPALQWFAANGIDATGITTNADDLRACREAGYNAVNFDMHAIPAFKSESFDLVWARHVLEHSPIPYFVLTEFARVLKPEGILYVEVPAPDTPSHHESNQNHYSVLGLEMWKQLITRAGFKIIEVRRWELKTGIGADLYFSFIAKKL